MRQLISSGSRFEQEWGYSRAVIENGWVFVSGTTGFDYAAMTIADDPVAQTHQAFRNLKAALGEANITLENVTRARYYVTRAEDWSVIAPIIGQYFREIRPAATAVVCGLIDPRMRIEIEVTARRETLQPDRQ